MLGIASLCNRAFGLMDESLISDSLYCFSYLLADCPE
jgi:hypothetical protein